MVVYFETKVLGLKLDTRFTHPPNLGAHEIFYMHFSKTKKERRTCHCHHDIRCQIWFPLLDLASPHLATSELSSAARTSSHATSLTPHPTCHLSLLVLCCWRSSTHAPLPTPRPTHSYLSSTHKTTAPQGYPLRSRCCLLLHR